MIEPDTMKTNTYATK